MTPFYDAQLSEENRRLFNEVRRLVTALPDLDLGTTPPGSLSRELYGSGRVVLSCHMLARALAKVLKLKCVDGHYAKAYAHSWLLTPDGDWIIDAYPVGMIGGPVLVQRRYNYRGGPGNLLYVPGRNICKVLPFGSPEFRRAVCLLTEELRKLAVT